MTRSCRTSFLKQRGERQGLKKLTSVGFKREKGNYRMWKSKVHERQGMIV